MYSFHRSVKSKSNIFNLETYNTPGIFVSADIYLQSPNDSALRTARTKQGPVPMRNEHYYSLHDTQLLLASFLKIARRIYVQPLITISDRARKPETKYIQRIPYFPKPNQFDQYLWKIFRPISPIPILRSAYRLIHRTYICRQVQVSSGPILCTDKHTDCKSKRMAIDIGHVTYDENRITFFFFRCAIFGISGKQNGLTEISQFNL